MVARLPIRDCRGTSALDPAIANLDVRMLDGRPGNAMGGLLLAGVARVARKCMIEGRPEYVLGMLRQVPPHREGKRVVRRVRHGRPPQTARTGFTWPVRLVDIGKATLRNIKQPQTLCGQACQSVSADGWPYDRCRAVRYFLDRLS